MEVKRTETVTLERQCFICDDGGTIDCFANEEEAAKCISPTGEYESASGELPQGRIEEVFFKSKDGKHSDTLSFREYHLLKRPSVITRETVQTYR